MVECGLDDYNEQNGSQRINRRGKKKKPEPASAHCNASLLNTSLTFISTSLLNTLLLPLNTSVNKTGNITLLNSPHGFDFFLSVLVPWMVDRWIGGYVDGLDGGWMVEWMDGLVGRLGWMWDVVAQLVERRPRDPMDSMIRGSNPVRSTRNICGSFSEFKMLC